MSKFNQLLVNATVTARTDKGVTLEVYVRNLGGRLEALDVWFLNSEVQELDGRWLATPAAVGAKAREAGRALLVHEG